MKILTKKKDNQSASRKCIFLGTSILSRFWEGFGWFSKARILDFGIFWHVLPIQIDIKSNLKEKNTKIEPLAGGRPFPGSPTPLSEPPPG